MPEANGLQGREKGALGLEKPVALRRPDYNKIHASPLPLKIHPLPPLIPHNPLSVLYIIGTYLSQLFYRPSSHPTPKYTGYFSPETLSVHVTDEVAIRTFWESGFFGKGSLSRSEPSWLIREKRRRGLIVGETSEEVTRKRREERKEFKKERARKERELIEQKRKEERRHTVYGDTITSGSSSSNIKNDLPDSERSDSFLAIDSLQSDRKDPALTQLSSLGIAKPLEHGVNNAQHTSEEPDIENQEHLQLNLEEAYFLAYALGVLEIFSPTTQQVLLLHDLLPLFMSHSTFPPVSASPDEHLSPDNAFLVRYVAYHHFRSLGWMVRPGVKFAVDLLLYNRGPVFSHAEFAVLVLPSYSHAFWVGKNKEKRRSWHWLYMVNRVQTQVRKSLVICYVEIPPPMEEDDLRSLDVGKLLKRYKVREIVLKRWVPNRSRD